MAGLLNVEHAPLLGSEPGELVLCVRGGAQDGQRVRVRDRKCTIGSAERSTIRVRSGGAAPVECLVFRGEHRTVVRRWQGAPLLNGAEFSEAALSQGDRLTFGAVTLEALLAPSFEPAPVEAELDGRPGDLSIAPAEGVDESRNEAPPQQDNWESKDHNEPAARARNLVRTAARLRDLRRTLTNTRNENCRLAAEASLLALQIEHLHTAREKNAEAELARDDELRRQKAELAFRERQAAAAEARSAEGLEAIKREQDAFDAKVLEIETNFSRERVHLQAEWLRLQEERNRFEDLTASTRATLDQEREAIETHAKELQSLRPEAYEPVREDATDEAAILECEARTRALAEAEAALQARERSAAEERIAQQAVLDECESALEQRAAALDARENEWNASRVANESRLNLETEQLAEERLRLENERAALVEERASLDAEAARIREEREQIEESNAQLDQKRARLEEERAVIERQTAELEDRRQATVATVDPARADYDPEQEAEDRRRIVESETRWMSSLRHSETEETPASEDILETEAGRYEESVPAEASGEEAFYTSEPSAEPEDRPFVEAEVAAAEVEDDSAEEPAAEQPASPVSAAELLKKFGFTMEEEEAYAEEADHEDPAPVAIHEAPKLQPEHKHSEHKEEDSIDDYMAQLLARVGGKSTAPQPAPTHRDSASRAKTREAVKPVAVAAPVEEPELFGDISEMQQRAKARESKSELSAMREIANLNARLAIDKSFRSKMKTSTTSKLLVMLSSLVCGLGMLVWWTMGESMAIFPAIGCLVITFVWGIQYAFLARRLAASRALEEEARGERDGERAETETRDAIDYSSVQDVTATE